MRLSIRSAALACLLAGLAGASGRAADAFEFRDGDRVVLLGNTLIEREQYDGYWETLLTLLQPDKDLTFRNLGWSGDTVFGESRAGFGTAADGFRHLKEHVHALKPTVILVGYGANEAFDGPAGLPRFKQGLNTLLDTLAETKARVVLLSPLRQEDPGRPLPDPEEQNRNLRLYRDVLRKVAGERGYPFVDFYDLLAAGEGGRAAPLTDNGIHLTAHGYWRSAFALARALGLDGKVRPLELEAEDVPLKGKLVAANLPAPPAPGERPTDDGFLPPGEEVRVRGLAPGRYTLRIDGQKVATAAAREWAGGVRLERGPDLEQVERLRRTIIEKNRTYFHRWRPQNETYLFGFRKHEQGRNAREIPQFDPLVARLEAEIARLRVPAVRTYELVKE